MSFPDFLLETSPTSSLLIHTFSGECEHFAADEGHKKGRTKFAAGESWMSALFVRTLSMSFHCAWPSARSVGIDCHGHYIGAAVMNQACYYLDAKNFHEIDCARIFGC